MANKSRNGKTGDKYGRILVVRLDRIGDVLLSTPAVRALRRAYPQSYIAFMVRPYAREVVDGNPCLDEIIIYDKEKDGRGFAGALRTALMLKKKKFDLAVILHPTVRTHLIAALARIPVRIGFDRKAGWLLTRRVPHTKHLGLKHEIDYTLDLVRYVGASPGSRSMDMPVKEDSERRVRDLFSGSGIGKDDKVVVINPGASCPSKRWMPESFASAADAIADRTGSRIVIISDYKDKALADSVESAMRNRPLNLAGTTTVSDLASVLKRADLFISNDSGPVHVACAVGTPAIVIFGRSDRGLSPSRWGPSGDKDVVLHKHIGCEVCLAHNCRRGFACLAAINPEDVVDAAEKILRR